MTRGLLSAKNPDLRKPEERRSGQKGKTFLTSEVKGGRGKIFSPLGVTPPWRGQEGGSLIESVATRSGQNAKLVLSCIGRRILVKRVFLFLLNLSF